jgi:hypothetical protein
MDRSRTLDLPASPVQHVADASATRHSVVSDAENRSCSPRADVACDRSEVTEGRTVWKVSAIIEATEDGALAAQEAIARTLCPDENHPADCPAPWTTMICRLEGLDPEERAEWEADFANDRVRARELGESGA